MPDARQAQFKHSSPLEATLILVQDFQRITWVHKEMKSLSWWPSSKLILGRGVPPTKPLGLTQSSMAPKLQSFWHKRLAFQLVGICAVGWQRRWWPLNMPLFPPPPPLAPISSVTTFSESAGIKHLYINSWRSTQNLGIDTFPDRYFGAPKQPFWILQAVSECRQRRYAGVNVFCYALLKWIIFKSVRTVEISSKAFLDLIPRHSLPTWWMIVL